MMYIMLTMAQSIGRNPVNLPNTNFNTTFPAIMQAVFGLAALLSVLFVAIGGFKYTTATGDPQGLQKAKGTIIYALIGLAISLSAYTIVEFVMGRLG